MFMRACSITFLMGIPYHWYKHRIAFQVIPHFRFFSTQKSTPNIQDINNQHKIIITERCLKRIHQVLESDELLRVGVRGGGCAGFEYEFSIEKRSAFNLDEDLLFENHVVIDRESLEYLIGSKVDFENELIRSGFCIRDNPLAEKNCSCGVSFSLKMDKIDFKTD